MLPLIGIIGASVAGGVVGGLAAHAISAPTPQTTGGYTPFVAGRKTVGQLRGDSQGYWTSWWNKHRNTSTGHLARTGVPGVW